MPYFLEKGGAQCEHCLSTAEDLSVLKLKIKRTKKRTERIKGAQKLDFIIEL